MCYYETLYSSYPTFMIRIDEQFQGEHPDCSASKIAEKEPRAGSDDAFGTKEAARRLGCSPGLVRRLAHRNLIEHKWNGKNLVFRSEHIEEYWKSDHGKSKTHIGGEVAKKGQRTQKRIEEGKGVKNTGVSRTDLKGRLSEWG
jgi:hypothetical protein